MKFIRDIIREKSRAESGEPALAATEDMAPIARDQEAASAPAVDEAVTGETPAAAAPGMEEEMVLHAPEPESAEMDAAAAGRRPITRDLSLSPTLELDDEDAAPARPARDKMDALFEDKPAQGENLFSDDAAEDDPFGAPPEAEIDTEHRDANGMDIAAPDPDMVADSVAGLLSRSARAAAGTASTEAGSAGIAGDEAADDEDAGDDDTEIAFETEIAAKPAPEPKPEPQPVPMPESAALRTEAEPEAPAQRPSFSEMARMMQERIDQASASQAPEVEVASDAASAPAASHADEPAPVADDEAEVDGEQVFDIAAATAPRTPRAAAGGRAGRAKTRLLGFSASNAAANPFEKAESAQRPGQAEFPVGWLVVTEGPGRGQSFTLFHGVSQIGRGEDQAIRLDFGDNSISRQNHAAIAYDAETRGFYLGHGGKANIVRLDERPVLSTEELKGGQQIRIGETTLKFIALCDADFDWNAADEEDERHALRG